MKPTRDMIIYDCQMTEDVFCSNIKEFIGFINLCLRNEFFVEAMNTLLPFDHCIQSKMKIKDMGSRLRSMGLCILRMEFEPPLFSLGVSVEIEGSEVGKDNNTTIFIAACRTIDELRLYAKTDAFAKQIKNNCEKLINASIPRLKSEFN